MTKAANEANDAVSRWEKAESLVIMGIGTSAGGEGALTEMFQHMPADIGLVFVVVMHRPDDSQLQQALRYLRRALPPHVNLQLELVKETVKLQRGHVYFLSSNLSLGSIDTHLRLDSPAGVSGAKCHRHAPIDRFFRVLAESYEDRAIGAILTGIGSDGSLGLRKIRERGGFTVVQDPAEAEYDEMPRSAIDNCSVDLVLRLRAIPEAALRFVRTKPPLSESFSEEKEGETERGMQNFIQELFAQVRSRTGRDFSHYKQSSVVRRVSRRMLVQQISEPRHYLEHVRKEPSEAVALADELLITVTNFFRDEEVFDTLARTVVPRLFDEEAHGQNSMRVWSVGCATGEEAYSYAMLLLEEASRRELRPALQIFASDLHERSLHTAREGFYPGTIESDVTPERLQRFFQVDGDGFRIREEVRELVLFASHNVLADPPYSHLDLISCRNLLIYLQCELQQHVVDLFHSALRPGGFLVLGTSESIHSSELFHVIDKKRGIYRRRDVPAREHRVPVFPLAQGRALEGASRGERAETQVAYGARHQRMVEQYAPPSVLVSPDNHVVHFSAHAGRYLVHPGGAPTTSVFQLVREELRVELRAAVFTARERRGGVRSSPVLIHLNGESVRVVLDVRPTMEPEGGDFLLLIFDEQPARSLVVDEANEVSASPPTLRELRGAKDLAEQRLQLLIEEYETSQEEARASQEELQSANEELRSTLEELETSKEELQSTNEELQTMNQENRLKVEELGQLSSDLQDLFAATEIATLLLDRELRILRFTPRITELFNMRPSDRGRLLTDFTHRLIYDNLTEDALQVIECLAPIEHEVRDDAGRWYLTRLLPYRRVEDHIAGVAVTFVEITRRKEAEEGVMRAKENSERIRDALPEPLLVLTTDLRVESANAAFYERFRAQPADTIGYEIYEVDGGEWRIPALQTALNGVLAKRERLDGHQVSHTFAKLGQRVLLLNARWVDDQERILLGIHDITDRFEAERALRDSEARLEAELSVMRRLHDLVARLLVCRDLPGALRCVLDAVMEITGTTMGTVHLLDGTGGTLELTEHSGFGQEFVDTFRKVSGDDPSACGRALRSHERVVVEDVTTDEDYAPYRDIAERVGYRGVQSTPLVGHNGELLGVLSTHYQGTYRPSERDLQLLDLYARQAAEFIERVRSEEAMRASESRLAEENRHKDEYLAMLGHELRNPLAAIRNAVELMKLSEIEDSRWHRVTAVLDRQTTHVTRIIDGLLEVSRIGRGKVRLELKALDLRRVLSRALQDNAPLLTARGLELRKNFATEPLWVIGDEDRLVQVLDNLIGNAVKFTEPPGSVFVALDHVDDFARICIRDTGVGIRPAMLSRIFEAFQQENQDTARSSGGLGLGLALVKGLVELHKGNVEARSGGPGEGAEFEIRLPLATAPVEDSHSSPVQSAAPRRILIVEDNQDAAEMLSGLLVQRGHHVRAVETGSGALRALREHGADVVLCDLGLPGVSGYDLARVIRESSLLHDVPLIALTGYGQAEDRKKTAEAGFDAHLVKPVDLRALDEILTHLSEIRRR